MIPRPDMLTPRSPKGIEVFQITTGDVPCSHVYMEAQVCTPDSKKVVVHRSAHPHGSDRHDPEHRYLLCDLATGELSPLTDELGPTAPSVSPDGKWFYYFVDRTELNAGSLALRRVRLDGTQRETIVTIDAPLPRCPGRPSGIYPLSSIRSDGGAITTAGFLGDGAANYAPWGLITVDIARGLAGVPLMGSEFCNLHPQYSRSLDPTHMRDILVQENHDCVIGTDGKIITLCGSWAVKSNGADVHVVRDDGTNFRTLPFGRNGVEYCQGHQCWVGRSQAVISTAGRLDRPTWMRSADAPPVKTHEEILIAGTAGSFAGHIGVATPNTSRSELNSNFPGQRFFHFATDIAGKRFITDANPQSKRGCDLYIATINDPLRDPLADWTFLVDTRTRFHVKSAHPHPCLTPDGKTAFFNSDESGVLHAYMIRGLP